uniref:Uncharacterized protein n=1 Tax=Cacopsylla melanoneura TaxID=428564 RepID=A0A8D9ABR1_9HEMI
MTCIFFFLLLSNRSSLSLLISLSLQPLVFFPLSFLWALFFSLFFLLLHFLDIFYLLSLFFCILIFLSVSFSLVSVCCTTSFNLPVNTHALSPHHVVDGCPCDLLELGLLPCLAR